MTTSEIGILIAIIVYMVGVVGIGVYFAKKNSTTNDFYLGGRKLGPLVTAMSAEASDMSSWLLMGLPGVAYVTGVCDAFWTAAGLAVGTYVNWLIVAKRLRTYSDVCSAITIPDFFANRYRDPKMLKCVSAIIIIIFFVPYTASGFAACGTLFNSVFGLNYQKSMIVCAIVIVLYTSMGGFLAASTTDLIQGLLMSFAIVIVLIVGVVNAGGVANVIAHGQAIEGFFDVMKYHDPATGGAVSQGVIPILSGLAWGLGYFGMPHIIIRFMSIKSQKDLKKSAKIGITWTLLIVFFATLIGVIGRLFLGFDESINENSLVFIQIVRKIFPGVISGILLSAVLAASMSTADSQLLAASSAFSSDVYKPVIRKGKASDKEMMWTGRIVVLGIAVAALIIASNPNAGSIMALVSNAWGIFGAAFGPAIMLSLFWKRFNFKGAVAGIITGAAVDILWYAFLTSTGIYELLPGFVFGLIAAVVVTLCTNEPSKEVYELFDKAQKFDE
mgnify:CR=1 FL=1